MVIKPTSGCYEATARVSTIKVLILSSAEAARRMRIALFASILLWLGAWMAWQMRADTALLQVFSTNCLLICLRPVFELYSRVGLFIFYVPFIALLVYGIYARRPLFRLVGLAYLYAQIFGTLLLVETIKFSCGRPRPYAVSTHDVFCPAPSLVHAFNSFPSDHAVDVAVGAMFVLLLLRSRVAALLALLAMLFMALARIAIGQHYLSDVLAGLALGVTITGVVMHVYLLPRWREIEAAPTQ
jgi:membrane-associated phospholipid phosphatase